MARERVCGIYKITNLINNKIYIGQSVNIYIRWSQHRKVGKYLNKYKDGVRPLYAAFNKYGLENFSFEIIEKCKRENLSEKEKYWIKYFDCTTLHNKGYNLTEGGESGNITQARQAFQYDKDGKFIAEFKSIKEATTAMGLSGDSGAIQNAIGKHKLSCEYQWRYEKKDNIEPFVREKKVTKVACYTMDGELVSTFNSLKEASRFFGVDGSAIAFCCTGKTKFCCGHKFLYFEDCALEKIDTSVIKRRKPGRIGRQVAQVKDGEIIRIFESTKEVAQFFEVKDRSQIYKACNFSSAYKTYKGYEWKWINLK